MEGVPKNSEKNNEPENVVTPMDRIRAASKKIKEMSNLTENIHDIAKLEVITRFAAQNPSAEASKPIIEALVNVEQFMDRPDVLKTTKENMLREVVEQEYNRLGRLFEQTGENEKWEKLHEGES